MRIFSVSRFGYESGLVKVEVDIRNYASSIDIVGLADSMVKESQERIKSAIYSSGLEYPDGRILVSLSPADLYKESSDFNLAIAIAILNAKKNVKSDDSVMILGKLTPSGNVLPVRNVFSAVVAGLNSGIKKFVIPESNKNELKSFDNIEYILADSLSSVMDKLYEEQFEKSVKDTSCECEVIDGIEFPLMDEDWDNDVFKGFEKASRAMMIAAAGGHNLMFYGPYGCGKTRLMEHMPALLPLNTIEESQSVTRIWSIAGLVKPSESLIRRKPFRMPHCTATIEGIFGGGRYCRPGEVSLAHNGILFLDDTSEFRSSVLQMLRVPLVAKSITLSHAGRCANYPANFQLLMSTNPCPCGQYGMKDKICLCSAKSVEQYWKKISFPSLEMIDMRVKIEKNEKEEHISIKDARKLVAKAVAVQRNRGFKNCDIPLENLLTVCKLDDEEIAYLNHEQDKKGITENGKYSLIKVARTIADLDSSENILLKHLQEAVSLREEPFKV